MEEYFHGFCEDVTDWEMVRAMTELNIVLNDELQNEVNKADPSVQLLPRQDVILYGTIPLMEQKIYTKCKECRLVFNPRDILSHKSCSSKAHLSSTPQNLKKKVKKKGSKQSQSSRPPPIFKKCPPVTTTVASTVSESKSSSTKTPSKISKIAVSTTPSTNTVTTTSAKLETRLSTGSPHSKSNSAHSPKTPSKSASSSMTHSPKSASKNIASSETVVSSSASSSSSSSNSSSRYKKSRKSNNSTKLAKEFDPDVHCGVVEGNRGPCTRSITCSNHRIHLRKLVPGRSKDIYQLISERKAAKEKELKSGSYMSPNGSEEKDVFSQNTTYVPIVATLVSTDDSPTTTYVPIMPKTTTSSTNRTTTTSILTNAKLNMTDLETKPTKTLDGSYLTSINSSQDSAVGTVPVVYMPMSPISVVSPVQFVQIGKNMICLESPQSATSPPLTTNQPVFLTIPAQSSQQCNVKMYKAHPKPIAIPSYGTKKIGGSILLSNQRIECQRKDILMAMNTKREKMSNVQEYRAVSLLNHTNMPHRPNILKVKSASRVACKRPAIDKSSVSDSKQFRLGPNVNGFILHSDISETADAPHSSNCIQEKIALLNMK